MSETRGGLVQSTDYSQSGPSIKRVLYGWDL